MGNIQTFELERKAPILLWLLPTIPRWAEITLWGVPCLRPPETFHAQEVCAGINENYKCHVALWLKEYFCISLCSFVYLRASQRKRMGTWGLPLFQCKSYLCLTIFIHARSQLMAQTSAVLLLSSAELGGRGCSEKGQLAAGLQILPEQGQELLWCLPVGEGSYLLGLTDFWALPQL